MTVPEQSMDKLVRITLINWYLFGAEDIAINGDIILFRGGNGAGKSSLLDAIQTVLAGGDESELLMNAASSDGKRSGRNIRSYALGVVADANGQQACEPRKESNTYLCLTFRKKNGTLYSAGIGMHARASDPKVKKLRFILEGTDLSSMDFMESDHVVMPWKSFEKRLKISGGQVFLPSTATDFRMKLAEYMSAAGANNQISPQMMLRTIKKAVGFKEQKCISTFTREHILPENTIDVVRIQNDYNQYKNIQSLIEEAKERVGELKSIESSYKRHLDKKRLSTSYLWCSYEAECTAADEMVQTNKERLSDTETSKEKSINELAELELTKDQLQNDRDSAYTKYTNSDSYLASQESEKAIADWQVKKDEAARAVGAAKASVSHLITQVIPASLSDTLKHKLESTQEKLRQAADLESDDLASGWPRDAAHIDSISDVLSQYNDHADSLQSDRDDLKHQLDTLQSDHDELAEVTRKLEEGQATLNKTTQSVINLLDSAGIVSIPVCELTYVNDSDWQIGIERFLGGNREALIVQAEDYTRALTLYRTAKDRDQALRSVKLVNPDDGFGFDGIPSPGTAAALIESNNPVALRFLRGLLHNVKLVETEEELRRERRAITKDGMVAGNGAISGGNRFQWVLIGKDARKLHAKKSKDNLASVVKNLQVLKSDFDPIDSMNQNFRATLSATINLVSSIPNQIATIKDGDEQIKKHESSLEQLAKKPDSALQKAFEEADNRLTNYHSTWGELNGNIKKHEVEIEQINRELPVQEEILKIAGENRKKCESLVSYCPTHAQETYDKLVEKFGDTEYSEIKENAEENQRGANKNSATALQTGISLLTTYITRYEPEDRLELKDMSAEDVRDRCQAHIDRIENAEMLGYIEDAREAREKMLANFRSEVVARLNESFQQLERTFRSLNDQLRTLTFNNNKYRFTHPVVESESLRTVYDYVRSSTDLERDSVGTMFDFEQENPAVKIIEEVLIEGRLTEIADYRNFYTFDIVATDEVTKIRRYFSELLVNGSGGEKQTPFYVALGASFMSAYKIRKAGDSVFGGAALAIFDEAFSKMDGNNAQTALNFFRDIGLQVILAAPPESEVKVGPYADTVYNVLRAGDIVYLDHKIYTPEGKALLESDDPILHPNLAKPYEEHLREKMADA